MARVCADARHTDDTHAFPQTTLFVVSKSRLIASPTRHLLVTEKKKYPPFSGRKKEPKPKLFGPDILLWSRGLPRERVGAKKFDTSLETREIKLFGRDIPGFRRDIPGAPEKFEKKRFVFNSCPLHLGPPH